MTWPPTTQADHRRAVVSKRIGRTFAVLLCCCTASVGSVPLAPAHRGILSPASADAAERHIISAATLRFRRENAVQVWGWGSTAVVPNRDTQRFTVMNAVATYPKEEMIYSNSRRIAPCIDASSCSHGRGFCENGFCVCSSPYVHASSDGGKTWVGCAYESHSKSIIFVLTLLLGYLGFPYWVLARGNPAMLCCGACKLITVFLTCGVGTAIWGTVDWVRVLTGDMKNADGAPLFNDM